MHPRPVRFLLTGAGGFLGRHLGARLASEGTVERFVGDVRDPRAFEGLPRVDVAFHLAAQSMPRRSVEHPRETWDVNVGGTLNVLEWARQGGAKRVVLASSAHVYGPAKYSPVDEEHPRRPVTPYGASKLAAESLALSYAASYPLEVVVVRPFNVYGPGQGAGFLVPDILLQLREGKQLKLGDPAPVRDFTFVDDAVAFFALAGSRAGVSGQALNLGSGEGHAVDAVVRTALRVAGSKLEPAYDPSRFRQGDLKELVVDNRRARAALGWAPKVGLEEGLRRTWEAMRA